MLEQLHKLWDSFQWCLSYTNNDGSKVNIEVEILDNESNTLCTMDWENLVYVTNEEITILDK